jgi:hypothetical protein
LTITPGVLEAATGAPVLVGSATVLVAVLDAAARAVLLGRGSNVTCAANDASLPEHPPPAVVPVEALPDVEL